MPSDLYLSDVFTVSANLVGVPAISIPVGENKEGLSIGIQIIAPWFGEGTLFNLGKEIQL